MPLSSKRLGTLLSGLLLALCTWPTEGAAQDNGDYFSYFSGWPLDTHPLDGLERFLEPNVRARSQCASRDDLVTYRGELIRFRPAARVHPEFAERLRRFEDRVVQISTAFYGRPPRAITHRGTYNCRLARGRRRRLSEHALGNALDLTGFDFGRMPREEWFEGQPRWHRRGFSIRIRTHWTPRRNHQRERTHATFLHAIAEDARSTPRMFRGIVGPPRPRHHDHLHLDASPWRYAMFTYAPLEGE